MNVQKLAGAAPALTAALQGPEGNVGDPYFGGKKAPGVLLETLKTAHQFPCVPKWDEIDAASASAMQEIGSLVQG